MIAPNHLKTMILDGAIEVPNCILVVESSNLWPKFCYFVLVPAVKVCAMVDRRSNGVDVERRECIERSLRRRTRK